MICMLPSGAETHGLIFALCFEKAFWLQGHQSTGVSVSRERYGLG